MNIRIIPQQIASYFYYTVWPSLRPGGYMGRLAAAARKRQGLDRQSPERVWERQREKINRLLRHAVEQVPYYRRLADAGDMPRSIETPKDMAGIPILTKEIIRREGKALVAKNFPVDKLKRNATGGSTGEPVHFWSDDTVSLEKNAAEWWSNTLAGMNRTSSIAYLWGAGRFEPSSREDFREGVQRFISNRMFINCFEMSPKDLERAHQRLSRFQPDGFIGYSSALTIFAEFLEQRGIQPKYPRTAILSAAETLNDVSRRTLDRVFGVPVYDRYGSREMGLVAMECEKHEGLHVNGEDVFVELIDAPEAEHLKKIILTKLNQYSMPFLRYDIEDLAEGPVGRCSCGRGYPVIKKIVGRVTETIRMPGGTCLPGEIFPHLFKDCGISTFQVTQAADYSVDVALVKKADQTPEQDRILRKVIQDHLGGTLAVTIRYVEHIERSATGKLLPVISKAPRGTAVDAPEGMG